MDPQDAGSGLIFVFLGAAIVLALISRSERAEPNLKHIPTLGRKGYIFSYIDALSFVFIGPSVLRTAYEQYRPGVFKLATLHRWLVVVTGTQLVEELRKFPEVDLSFVGLANEADTPLLHPSHCHSPGSEDVSALTRYITQNVSSVLPYVREGISSVLSSSVKPSEGTSGWTETDPTDLILRTVNNSNNRLFFGLPISGNADYKSLSTQVSLENFTSQYTFTFNLFPKYTSGICKFFLRSYRNRRKLRTLFTTMAHERVESANSKKELITLSPTRQRESIPNDVLTWIVNDDSKQASVDRMVSHLFDLNQTATQTISTNFLHVLYYLSANPKYASPMRKEIESIVSREGWSKSSLDKMHKLDSFIKESLRMSGMPSVTMVRKAHVDITLSDGTFIPSGTVLAAAARPRHLDGSIYGSTASTFDGFRFSKLLEDHAAPYDSAYPSYQYTTASPSSSSSSSSYPSIPSPPMPSYPTPSTHTGTRHLLTTTTTSYLAWGYGGQHACPGRFYAAVVMKVMLAVIVLGYDVRFEDGLRPRDVVRGGRRLPWVASGKGEKEGRFMLRKR